MCFDMNKKNKGESLIKNNPPKKNIEKVESDDKRDWTIIALVCMFLVFIYYNDKNNRPRH